MNRDNLDMLMASERINSRFLIGIFLGVVMLGIAMSYHFLIISKKDEIIRDLSNNRVMWGILSDDGRYLKSVKEIPNGIIQNFSRSFIHDWTNFTPETLKMNYESALKKTSIAFRREHKRDIARYIASRIQFEFSQQFIPKTYTLNHDPENHQLATITIEGQRKQWQNERLINPDKQPEINTYMLKVRKSVPTESHPEGLEVIGVKENDAEWMGVENEA